ncbi:hypothetical protein CCACVL1_19795 [Corchorus capsularis]|uniref:Uncharacterized protein n=1 Tax=Corchorus capsularis TaxID=210143 RepID=A0A1R3HEX7_COCAP|nr:hypothetical protein CCACVL1_19795 [Corchorus capsularis]
MAAERKTGADALCKLLLYFSVSDPRLVTFFMLMIVLYCVYIRVAPGTHATEAAGQPNQKKVYHASKRETERENKIPAITEREGLEVPKGKEKAKPAIIKREGVEPTLKISSLKLEGGTKYFGDLDANRFCYVYYKTVKEAKDSMALHNNMLRFPQFLRYHLVFKDANGEAVIPVELFEHTVAQFQFLCSMQWKDNIMSRDYQGIIIELITAVTVLIDQGITHMELSLDNMISAEELVKVIAVRFPLVNSQLFDFAYMMGIARGKTSCASSSNVFLHTKVTSKVNPWLTSADA